ncbi:MAG: alcohol dehydrogenase catalytic domain-containing protein, partial [Nitrospiraceae bacterium]
MKAMVLNHTGDVSSSPLRLEDRPVPVPGEGQVLVNIHICGVCRTDLHVVEGELADIKLPLVPGHQAVGTVAQVGSMV